MCHDIKDLRSRGLRVYVRHKRMFDDFPNTEYILEDFKNQKHVDVDVYRNILFSNEEAHERELKALSPRGGSTEVDIYDGEELIGSGEAFCSPNEQFCKSLGRIIAIGRALKKNAIPA